MKNNWIILSSKEKNHKNYMCIQDAINYPKKKLQWKVTYLIIKDMIIFI